MVMVLLGTGWWLLSGQEGSPSPLAAVLGTPDTSLHKAVGWGLFAVTLVGVLLGRRGLRTFVADSLRFRSTDLRWFASWPRAVFTGRFSHHDGRFDPGQRILNIVLVSGLVVLIVSGAGLVLLHGGPLFAVLDRVHRWATYVTTLLIFGHVLVASGVLPGYHGVWRSMHLGGRLDQAVARRLWPTWSEWSTRCPSATSVAAFLINALDQDERIAIERHLRRCASCRKEAAELSNVVRLLNDRQVN